MEKADYDNSIEIKAIVWEVKEGKPTKIKALNTIFIPEKQDTPQPTTTDKPEPIPTIKILPTTTTDDIPEPLTNDTPDYNKGKNISKSRNNLIYENVLKEVKEGIEKDESQSELMVRITPYYPENKQSSIKVYLYVHRKFIEDKKFLLPENIKAEEKGNRITSFLATPIFTNILERVKMCDKKHEMVKVVKTYYPNLKKRSVEKYAHVYYRYIKEAPHSQKTPEPKKLRKSRRPKDAVGKDEVYNTWVMKDEYDKVKRAINKWGFKATTQSISDVTGIRQNRVRAILHMLQKKHDVYLTYEDLTPIYHVTDKDKQKE